MESKRVAKAQKNRIYAQQSRKRHRDYVAKLEGERDALMGRVVELEQQQQRMLLFMQNMMASNAIPANVANNSNDSPADPYIFKTDLSSSYLLTSNMTNAISTSTASTAVPSVLLALLCPLRAFDSPSSACTADTLLVNHSERVLQMNWSRRQQRGQWKENRLRAATWQGIMNGKMRRCID